ncbi:hypothetical protein [Microvirga antarctica]|uniref:hypothetical protein n=1 Tax=Microvirga antarctica TaxID=2819233 RepID=UPI001B311A50|nr:hypothetical protein [Microvirga antarctica]
MMKRPLLGIALLALAAVLRPIPGHSAPLPNAARSWFLEQGYVPPDGGLIIACHGYGCSRRLAVSLDGNVMPRAAALLKSGRASPEAERRALSEIVKVYTGQLAHDLGGEPDTPGSPPQMSGHYGQMDCIDETANTTSLLVELDSRGLLAYHHVERPQSRGLFIDGRYPHVTAVITENRDGTEWAVDPWRHAPGEKPDILPLSQWRQDS